MTHDEIITGLKNAIARKESLEKAMQIMIDSGYDAREVQEASKFIGRGALSMVQPKSDEQLTMPEQKKGFFTKLKFWEKKPETSQIQETAQPQQIPAKPEEEIPSPSAQTAEPQPEKTKIIKGSLAKQLEQIKPKNPTHLREIILIIILLILLIILAVIIFFKGTIFGWFTS